VPRPLLRRRKHSPFKVLRIGYRAARERRGRDGRGDPSDGLCFEFVSVYGNSAKQSQASRGTLQTSLRGESPPNTKLSKGNSANESFPPNSDGLVTLHWRNAYPSTLGIFIDIRGGRRPSKNRRAKRNWSRPLLAYAASGLIGRAFSHRVNTTFCGAGKHPRQSRERPIVYHVTEIYARLHMNMFAP
jgi:hypothetical protein